MTAPPTEQHAGTGLHDALDRETDDDTRPRYELCLNGEKMWTTTNGVEIGYLALAGVACGYTVAILRATYHPGTRTWSRKQVFCKPA